MSLSRTSYLGDNSKRDAAHLDDPQPTVCLVPIQGEDLDVIEWGQVEHERKRRRLQGSLAVSVSQRAIINRDGNLREDSSLSINAVTGRQPFETPILQTRGLIRPEESILSDLPLPSLPEDAGQRRGLNKSVYYHKPATPSTRKLDMNGARRLDNLGYKSLVLFARHWSELLDLDESVGFRTKTLSIDPSQDDSHAKKHHDLGNVYTALFNYSGELPSLDKAIEYQTRAVMLTSDSHTDKAPLLSGLARVYRIRFDHQSDLLDLHRSIEYETEAVALISGRRPGDPYMLSSLGESFLIRFHVLGGLSDLSKSIGYGERAVSLTFDGFGPKAEGLGNLGSSYLARFKHLGELLDLNKSISYGAKAVALTPHSHIDRPKWLGNLSNSYLSRFERLGELPDLKKAIKYGEETVSLTPDGHESKPARVGHLGDSYLAQFERLGELGHLNKAIKHGILAASLTPHGHPDKPSILSTLGRAYLARFERLRQVLDLNDSIKYGTEAVSDTPNGHTDRPRRLGILGNAYLARFRCLGELPDLNKAIGFYADVVSLTPDGLASKPRWLASLGHAYYARYESLRNTFDIESAIVYYRMAGQSPAGSPIFRFQACREWARLSFRYTAFSPYLAYQQTMDLLPQLVWIGTSVDRRYNIIKAVGNLTMEAASHAIAIGSYNRALEWLEAGRSIVWGQIAQLRAPVDQLAIQRPELANRIREVGRKLENTTSELSTPSSHHGADPYLDSQTIRHHELAVEWERLLNDARSTPGFENVFCSPKSSQLLAAATSHPIAVINVDESRCDALILQPSSTSISHIPLTKFTVKSGVFAHENLVTIVGRERGRGFKKAGKPGSLKQSLKDLWLSVVKPILVSLGYTRKLAIDQLPRITWCTTGLLSFLPLHAAGCYDGTGPHTFDFVVSSYIPTLSALLKPQSADPENYCGVLAVGQETTPGFEKLPYTNDELATIKQHAGVDNYLQLDNNCATVDRVLEAMDRFSWIHMACHGTQNPSDPRQSAFYLHDGELTLATIASRSFRNKGLAFLSACQTAMGDQNIPEESVHLAAGMLMAGFPSVIGTMWGIADEDGPQVADRVYAELLSDGKPNHIEAARALHKATADLRKRVGVDLIARWAPFIHIGV